MIDLMKIFEGNVRNYHTLNLNTDHGKDSFTMAEIEYFARLGSMLGYYSFTEDTCNGRNRPMDLTWWDSKSGEEWDEFVLHLGSYFDVVTLLVEWQRCETQRGSCERGC